MDEGVVGCGACGYVCNVIHKRASTVSARLLTRPMTTYDYNTSRPKWIQLNVQPFKHSRENRERTRVLQKRGGQLQLKKNHAKRNWRTSAENWPRPRKDAVIFSRMVTRTRSVAGARARVHGRPQ